MQKTRAAELARGDFYSLCLWFCDANGQTPGLRLAVLASDHVEASHVTSCTLFARLFDPKQGSLQEKLFVIPMFAFGKDRVQNIKSTGSFDSGYLYKSTRIFGCSFRATLMGGIKNVPPTA